MRVAAPFMSTFVIYLFGLSVSVFSYKKFKNSIRSAKYVFASVFLGLVFLSFGFLIVKDSNISLANTFKSVDATFPVASNSPIGTAIGLHPGRVVWIHDEDATKKSFSPNSGSGNYWWESENADETVIKDMLSRSLTAYAGTETIGEAWDAIFKAFNGSHDKGDVGYTEGEKIAVKINLTNQCCTNEERMDATPQLVNALLHELINNVGVTPSDITLGDPYREFRDEYEDIVAGAFPGVNYVDGNGGSPESKTVPSDSDVLMFSNGNHQSSLPQYYLDAEYFINMPCLKTHNDGGITLVAKNHQGSFLLPDDNPDEQSAYSMHPYLPSQSSGSGKYRHIVDYMGHEQTHGKGLLYIVDGIWGGVSWEGYIEKFVSAPFNVDYPNSILISQDPVALESVCFDILFKEYEEDPNKGGSRSDYPIEFKMEIADGLKQMASSDFWPSGLEYDPEGDGSSIGSLGVFEHWNNATDRQYSRNLDPENGTGIELILKSTAVNIDNNIASVEINVGPNPFSDYTTFTRPEFYSDNSTLSIYSIEGKLINAIEFNTQKKITWNGVDAAGSSLSNGVYLYTVTDLQNGDQASGKVVLSR
jgi:hypothetical protein